MNINTGFNPYNSNYVNNADLTKMSQSQSLTGSPQDSLKEGEIFEGSVNSIDNGKVTIGLANGQTMTARLDSGVSLLEGQSVFFQVKSNDGNLIQIRPVSLGSLDANPTLLKALDMANIAATERTINMVNSMMQHSLSISPESLAAMNRAMINNPGVDPQTLVTMSKYGMEMTPENVNMFQNYANDKALIIDNFDTISEMLPELMSSKELSASDVISINNSIREIFIPEVAVSEEAVVASEQANPQAGQTPVVDTAVTNEANTNQSNNIEVNPQSAAQVKDAVINNAQDEVIDIVNQNPNSEQAAKAQGIVPESEILTNSKVDINQQVIINENEASNQVLNSFAGEKQITSFNTLLNSLPDFPKDNLQIFSEDGSLRADADINQVFKEITDYFNNHPDIPKETLNDIIREPLYKGILKNIIANSFAMEPKDITKPGEISKLYERVLKQTEALERLMASFSGKAAETIKNQTAEIRQNINFMNSANEMYNFVQIPLKMYNQNTDSMLYVRQNKKSSYEAGEEITAFLHFDMEHLGSTDVFIRLKENNVGCKWNLASEESMKLIEDNLDILTARLEAKGFSVKSEVTCGEPKTSFVEDFLGAPPVSTEDRAEGLVHRYSFDMRA
ncbi:hook-length control protein FliK [Pseudobutyrivibrio sp. NOR37]|uniref:Flagellar hook-length control protein FliK n=1 Tax=Pseudobutyrivibrio xylanivorans TaxID=185007 RepID=A0A6M0LF26_PSEXY|nr:MULTISPECIES: flagellar hook-length control protein FliK [Pseudobutyrivibrio]NEX01212.1 flagellar hook-length control protein FliK [Pseudobutyrivibrio xylanivorans]SFR65763.1 hook-length control protein FliK [Pseudobutyrivibrio sp. NOR37]